VKPFYVEAATALVTDGMKTLAVNWEHFIDADEVQERMQY
jgi:hypothetical protein